MIHKEDRGIKRLEYGKKGRPTEVRDPSFAKAGRRTDEVIG